MPRKRRSSAESEEYDVLAKKLKRIERKLKRVRRKRVTRSSSDSPRSYGDTSPPYEETQEIEHTLDEIEAGPSSSSFHPITLEPDAAASGATASDILNPVEQSTEQTLVPELDNEVLEILGDDPTVPKVKSKEVQPALAVRLEHIATSGLTTEIRKEIFNKYTLPSNCVLIGAPELNLEVKAAVSEVVLKRDQSMETKQKQLGIAISCLTEAMAPLLTSGKDPTQLQLMMDAARMLCDIQFKQSTTRRSLLLSILKKELKDQMQGTKMDKFLFGSDLAEGLKAAKAISKSGAELKPKTTSQAAARKSGSNFQTNRSHPSTSQSQHLNWKAPPPGRRQTGTQRRKEPAAYRSQHGRSSRRSSQQDRGRSRR